jgi:hypothetical protein
MYGKMCSTLFGRKIQERILGRVINTQTPGKERQQLINTVIFAIRELAKHSEINPQVKDLSSYVALALCKVSDTVEVTTAAWEKRGYWLKADHFRLEWIWAEEIGGSMTQAIFEDDWDAVMQLNIAVAEHLQSWKTVKRNRYGEPWVGAHLKLVEKPK